MNKLLFKSKYDKYTNLVTRKILFYLKNPNNQKTITAARYAVIDKFRGYAGFYRSKILFYSGEILGFNSSDLLDAAIGIEFIHTSSLIFDDMPFMDNAKMRRGKKCTHLQFGEDIATLTALYLLVEGISLILKNAEKFDKCYLVHKELNKTLQLNGLIGGQEIDLIEDKNFKTTIEGYLKKNYLMHFALVLPCLLKDKKYFNELSSIGKNICITYQLHDDLRDKMSSEITGKNEKKSSFKLSNIINEDKLKNMKNKYIQQSLKTLKKIDNSEGLNLLFNHIFFERK